MNGTTNQDRTNYFETRAGEPARAGALPRIGPHAVAGHQPGEPGQPARRGAGREAAELRQPALRRHAARPCCDLAYNSFAYKHTTIGSMADLNAATLDDVRQFFKTYYAPNNACIAVVGDFKEGDAKRLVEKYFGRIPRQPAPPPVEMNEQPLNGEKRKVLTDPLARLTRYEAAYKTVPGNHPDCDGARMLGTHPQLGPHRPALQRHRGEAPGAERHRGRIPRAAAPACSRSPQLCRPAATSTRWRRRSTRRSRGSRRRASPRTRSRRRERRRAPARSSDLEAARRRRHGRRAADRARQGQLALAERHLLQRSRPREHAARSAWTPSPQPT